MRVLIITHPTSGGSDAELIARIEAELARLGDTTVLAPESLDDFDDEVHQAARGAELVVVAGGDGTFNRTVNALHDGLEQLTFGLVPMGTGNDLARTLNLSREPLEAAAAIAAYRERAIDVGRASGPTVHKLFVNACMGGFPVDVDEAVDPDLKKRIGALAYWVGGAKAAVDFEPSTVTMDGIQVSHCVAVGVGNGRTCGGGIEVWPRADPDDGKLNGCALPAANYVAALRLGTRVRVASHEDLPEVRTCEGERIEIAAKPGIEFNVDGELVDLRSPAVFELVGRLKMRLPDRSTN